MYQSPDSPEHPSLIEYPKMSGEPRVRLRDLSIRDADERDELMSTLERLMSHGQWIMGPEVEAFERDVAGFFGRKHCVGVASASAGLLLTLKALSIEEGDEVITTPMSWLVTSTAISLVGAIPVFVDVDSNFNLDPECLEAAISSRTRAILPVHFYGRVANMPRILEVARRHGLVVIEDVAQAVGASIGVTKAGGFGDVGVVSFSPMKVIGGLGDAGAIVCDDANLAEQLRLLRHCGTIRGEICVVPEIKHNIDALNAAVIRLRLSRVEQTVRFRRKCAEEYTRQIHDVVSCPNPGGPLEHVFFDYTICTTRRSGLIEHLVRNRIEVKVRHPILIPDQPVFGHLRRPVLPVADRLVSEILCLPLHGNIKSSDIEFVSQCLRDFLVDKPIK